MSLFYLLVFAIAAYLVWSRNRARAVLEEEALTLVERRASKLLTEFPDLSDEAIALLIRDELQSRRVRGSEAYRVASAQTVGRVRRTMAIARERARNEEPKKLPPIRLDSADS